MLYQLLFLSDSKYVPNFFETTEENGVNPEEYDVDLDKDAHNNEIEGKISIRNETSSKDENKNTVDINNNSTEIESERPTLVTTPTSNLKEIEEASNYWHDMKEQLVIL